MVFRHFHYFPLSWCSPSGWERSGKRLPSSHSRLAQETWSHQLTERQLRLLQGAAGPGSHQHQAFRVPPVALRWPPAPQREWKEAALPPVVPTPFSTLSACRGLAWPVNCWPRHPPVLGKLFRYDHRVLGLHACPLLPRMQQELHEDVSATPLERWRAV